MSEDLLTDEPKEFIGQTVDIGRYKQQAGTADRIFIKAR